MRSLRPGGGLDGIRKHAAWLSTGPGQSDDVHRF
jgi:hypothetical protein